MNKDNAHEYGVVESANAKTLENIVTKLLSNGWELQGGLCVYRDRDNWTIYAQALTKKES